jgi:hypothetical protein
MYKHYGSGGEGGGSAFDCETETARVIETEQERTKHARLPAGGQLCNSKIQHREAIKHVTRRSFLFMYFDLIYFGSRVQNC